MEGKIEKEINIVFCSHMVSGHTPKWVIDWLQWFLDCLLMPGWCFTSEHEFLSSDSTLDFLAICCLPKPKLYILYFCYDRMPNLVTVFVSSLITDKSTNGSGSMQGQFILGSCLVSAISGCSPKGRILSRQWLRLFIWQPLHFPYGAHKAPSQSARRRKASVGEVFMGLAVKNWPPFSVPG